MKKIIVALLVILPFLSCETNDKDITNKITILPTYWEYGANANFDVETESNNSVLNVSQYIKMRCFIPRYINRLLPDPNSEDGTKLVTLDITNITQNDILHFYYVIEKKEPSTGKYHPIKPKQTDFTQEFGKTIMTNSFYYATTKYLDKSYFYNGENFWYECKIVMSNPGNYRVKIINPTTPTNQYLEISNTTSADISPFDLKIYSFFQANSEKINTGYFYFEVI